MKRRVKKDQALRFVISTHRHLEGARLSLIGHWANIAHPSVEDAHRAARAEAGDRPYGIERKDY